MKTPKTWLKEHLVFNLTNEELIKQVQLDAYNSAVKNCWKNVTLCIDEKPISSKTTQTYSPSQGIKTIGVSEQSILGLIQDV